MAQGTTATDVIGELVKRVYSPEDIQDLTNTQAPVLAKIGRRGSGLLGGEKLIFAVRSKPAAGFAFISETQDLPDATNSTILQASLTPSILAGVVETTGLVRSVTSQNPMAFAEAFEEQMSTLMEHISAYKEGAFFRDGSGVLATFTDNPGGGSAGPYIVSETAHLRPGMFVDIIDAADNTRHHEDIEIADVDWVAGTVTFGENVDVAVAATDKILQAGSQASSGALVSKEYIGFEGSLLSTGTYLGLSKTNLKQAWASQSFDVSGNFDVDTILRSRTRLQAIKGLTMAQINAFEILCHPMQADSLARLAFNQIRYNSGGPFDLANGDEVKVGGIKLVTTYNCAPTKAYLGPWDKSQMLYTPNGQLQVDTEKGGSAMKWLNRKDAGLTYVREYGSPVVKRPDLFTRFYNLTELSR